MDPTTTDLLAGHMETYGLSITHSETKVELYEGKNGVSCCRELDACAVWAVVLSVVERDSVTVVVVSLANPLFVP